jgi:hypothetical protein
MMGTDLNEFLNNKTINAWNLFWLIAGPISLAMVIAMLGADLSSGEGVSPMIQLSVRCAVPLLYLTFAASAVQKLFPGPLGRWFLRNRKYLGLSFAAAMAWQGLFILWMVIIYSDYYINEVYVMRDAIEGVVGYLFLFAMTVTTFQPGRKLLRPKKWRLLHLSGIYFLWAYAFSVYWWALFYYGNPILIDYIFYWGGFAAWGLRAAAWNKLRRKKVEKSGTTGGTQPVIQLAGIAIFGTGLLVATFGTPWRELAEQYLYGYTFTRLPELYLPYWPFEPYIPLLVIALGALVITKARS